MSSINIDKILENPESLPCNCRGLQYVDKDRDHISNWRFSHNLWQQILEIFRNCLKFRKSRCTVFEIAKASIGEGIDDYINTWCTEKEISNLSLLEWKTTVNKKIDNKIINVRNDQIRKTLTDFHQNYIVIPRDKASGKVAIICKRICALTLMKELGVTKGNWNSSISYEIINTTNENDIIDKHTSFMKR